ncbi:MAG: hypothetical protein IT508_11305, partial [Burkholderiaceae bacterium]|nr:hypothetical protein [Burkholderiaceae bacterium]
MLFSPRGEMFPAAVLAWVHGAGLSSQVVSTGDELLDVALRSRPRLVILDARDISGESELFAACARLKADSFTGIVP